MSFLFREVKGNFFYKIMVIVDGKGNHIQDFRTGSNLKQKLSKNNYFQPNVNN